MKTTLVLLCSLLFSSIALASVDQAALKDSKVITYESAEEFEDGIVFISGPKAYARFLGAATSPYAEANATIVCNLLGMKYYDYSTRDLGVPEQVVNFIIDAGVPTTRPRFGVSSTGLREVICKKK